MLDPVLYSPCFSLFQAVAVAMSCFALLCEEADIRGGSDEVTATYLLPNYHVYQATLSPPLDDVKYYNTKRICYYTIFNNKSTRC
jgi:neurofibromin 1